jgi:excisionase family DNA binding protein
MNERERVSLNRAAEICEVSRRTIYNWLATKKIEGVRTAGGSIRIYVDTLFHELNTDEIKQGTGHGSKVKAKR